MDIRDRRILILGGWGLVGTAILRRLIEHNPKEVAILSLHEHEAIESCALMRNEAPNIQFTPFWGNIFVRTSLKDLNRNELLNNSEHRKVLCNDTMESFTDEQLNNSYLYTIIRDFKPHIIIDTVNTATALAYQDIYTGYYNLNQELKKTNTKDGELQNGLNTEVEKMLTTLYIPQIIRHIQILHASMLRNNTGVYLKIGTTGTGGMGLNIPYTHSEERPSRVLLSKASLAGAHTMLLFLMGRTPGGPICKEIKPAAAIAWKGIRYGEISKHGKPVNLYDCSLDQAEQLEDHYDFKGNGNWTNLNKTLKSVYIDTGENGIFSQGEFETITSAGQMEFVTPEEIAKNVIMEILGDSTGHDILNALDNSIMGPTYRAGYMRHQALNEMDKLKKKHNSTSVAFEILGPPRLSKLLYEAHLLKQACGDLKCITAQGSKLLVEKVEEMILNDETLRSQIISIGLPILLSDGERILRGPEAKIPVQKGREKLEITPERIEKWAYAGWVDLREKNIKRWLERIDQIIEFVEKIPHDDTSSRYHHGIQYWDAQAPMNIGKVAAWIFINEDKGLRIK